MLLTHFEKLLLRYDFQDWFWKPEFQDWRSEESFSSEQGCSIEDGFYARKVKPTFNAVWDNIRRGWEMGSERIRSLKKPLRFYPRGARSVKEQGPKKKILDPQGSFLQNWNKIFMLVCVLAVAIDPLFFYIPWVNGTDKDKCLDLDHKMEAAACVLRTFIDVVYILRIAFQFRTGFIAPSSRVFGRGELVEDPKVIAKKYLTSHFIIDILAILPLPQVVVIIILPSVDGPVSLAAKNLLEFVIFSQYIPRFVRIYPLFKEITRTSGILTETAWVGAVFNLFLYMLASHIIGAFWYLFSIEREDACWREVCKDRSVCDSTYWYCGNHRRENYTFLTESCPFIQPDQIQNSSVFNFGIFTDALDSGVVESTYFPRKFFYCFWWGLRNLRFGDIWLSSSVLNQLPCSHLQSVELNLLKYLESTTVRIEEMRVKRRDAEQWMSHRMLPDNLKERIRRHEQYRWQETRGVEERGLIRNLPKDLRRDINRHLCLDLIKKVRPDISRFSQNYATGTMDCYFPYISSSDYCKFANDHCTEVTTLIYWRKQAKSFRQAEEKLQDALANTASTSPSLHIAIYASQFAANALRNLRQNGTNAARLPQRLSFLPQKPTEPDFSTQHHK
ncbi:hypothetical protein POTOM_008476 [Populus tomentosa]|uniref:Ion transport domain-containing protein n=1 Tax=Populus tomentosa TaxID=118781 RepID=A0A8X8DE65_POPTO|nr:hypothetical protein POTOM_008476 [Populus tomentosa]